MQWNVLIGICGVSLIFWMATTIRMISIRGITPPLCQPLDQYKDCSVSIIVPARDEERDIELSLRSLLSQQGIDLELLAVNDHSNDTTGVIVDSLAREDNRLTVLHNPELKPGWFGKANAMQTAANQAHGDYLLFTDADVEHAPDVVWSAITEMEKGAYDFMTLVPRFEIRTFWENVDLPMLYFGLALFASKSLEDPNKPDAIGGGAFLLVRRSVFEAIGGFEPIKNEMFDDVSLARLIKSKGYKVGIRLAIDRLRLELFKTNRDAFLAPTKNILMVGKGHPWIAAPIALGSIPLYWVPVASAIIGLVTSDLILFAAGAGSYLAQYFSFYLTRSTLHFHPLKLLAYPLVVLVILTCTARALYFYYIKGSVAWRGRVLKHSNKG